MTRYTQSSLAPGNCWQTAVACVLELEPEALPCQVTIERAGKSYHNALNSYLIRHHRLFYSELYSYQFSGLRVRPDFLGGYYVAIGPTVRTPNRRANHAVVARLGRVVWDVHPSRSGLLEVRQWGVFGIATEQHEHQRAFRSTDPTMACLCPKCCPPEELEARLTGKKDDE